MFCETLSLDNSFLTSLMVKSWDAGDVWIGLNDLIPRGTYKWTDNTTVDYSSWYTHEPHDHTASGSCVKATLRQRSMEGKMYWLDSDCTEKLAYVCKKYKGRPICFRCLTYKTGKKSKRLGFKQEFYFSRCPGLHIE